MRIDVFVRSWTQIQLRNELSYLLDMSHGTHAHIATHKRLVNGLNNLKAELVNQQAQLPIGERMLVHASVHCWTNDDRFGFHFTHVPSTHQTREQIVT